MLKRENAPKQPKPSKMPQFNFPQIYSFDLLLSMKFLIITPSASIRQKSKRLLLWLLLIATLISVISTFLKFPPIQFRSSRASESSFRVLQSSKVLSWSVNSANLPYGTSQKAFNWIRSFSFLEFKIKLGWEAKVS